MSNAADADFPVITPTEAARRHNAVRQAEATVRLEGGTTSPEQARLDAAFITGGLDLDSYLAACIATTRRPPVTPVAPARTR
jgi:hypothetical protein